MDSATLCRRIKADDATLTEVHMFEYTDCDINNVLRALAIGGQIRIQGLKLTQSHMTVKSFSTLVSFLCKPKIDPDMNDMLSTPLKTIHLYSLDDQTLEAITCRLFRGIEVDGPRGISQIEEVKIGIGNLSERTAFTIKAVLQVQEFSMLWKLSFYKLNMAESTFRIFCLGLSVNTSLMALEIAACDIGD